MIMHYRDLVVWQKAVDLAVDCYGISSRFPRSERYGITVQLREAVASIAANIAEGHGRRSPRDFHRFLNIAYGSLNEATTFLHLAVRLGFCDPAELAGIEASSDEIARMINGLQKALRDPKGFRRP